MAFVKNGSTLAFYVDGTQQGQRTDTTVNATANTSPLYIGRRGGTALQGYFTGSVDDVRIYPRACRPKRCGSNISRAGATRP